MTEKSKVETINSKDLDKENLKIWLIYKGISIKDISSAPGGRKGVAKLEFRGDFQALSGEARGRGVVKDHEK